MPPPSETPKEILATTSKTFPSQFLRPALPSLSSKTTGSARSPGAQTKREPNADNSFDEAASFPAIA
jgi:hypothetical protein